LTKHREIFSLKGKTDRIKEGIVFVNAKNLGFGVLRILGDEINPAGLLSLSKKIDPDQFEASNQKFMEHFHWEILLNLKKLFNNF